MIEGAARPRGNLTARKISGAPSTWERWQKRIRHAAKVMKGEAGVIYAELSARHFHGATGEWEDLGVIGTHLVTTEFVELLVDELNNNSQAHNRLRSLKFHDSGVGITDPAIGDTDIETTDGESRVSGSQAEGSSTNIYKSIATIAYSTTKAITEWGLFSAAAPADELLDRDEFAAINVVSGDSIEFTYNLTISAGG